MPVRFVRGDLFASGADTLVNPVNCVGETGAGRPDMVVPGGRRGRVAGGWCNGQ
jgi:hypothetical protein